MKRVAAVVIVLVIIAGILVYALRPRREDLSRLPQQKPDLYYQMVSAFTVAATRLKVGDDKAQQTPGVSEAQASRELEAVFRKPTEIIPGEPAGWANLALWFLRKQKAPQAEEPLKRARELKPDWAFLELLYGNFEKQKNAPEEARKHFLRAIELQPKDARIRYGYIDFLGSQTGSEAQALEQWKAITELRPKNVKAWIQLADLAAKTGNKDLAKQAVEAIGPAVARWPQEKQAYYKSADDSLKQPGDQYKATVPVLKNISVDTIAAKQGSDELNPTLQQFQISGGIIDPLERFEALPNPPDSPAPPDEGLSFTPGAASLNCPQCATLQEQILVPEIDDARAKNEKAVGAKQGPAYLIGANGSIVSLQAGQLAATIPFPGAGAPPAPEGVLLADWSYHFRYDMVLAGEGGIRLLIQNLMSGFTDVTAQTGLPAAVTGGKWTGAWAADIESDSDLDIVLGSASGLPTVLRNNGNKTFAVTHPFQGVDGLTGFAWADVDGDGDVDPAIIDGKGAFHAFENLRGGLFKEWPAPAGLKPVLALAAADGDRDGLLDFVALQNDGSVVSISHVEGDQPWKVAEIARAASIPTDGSARIYFADLDLNGAQDLIITSSTGTEIWLGGAQGKLKLLKTMQELKRARPSEPGANGRIDLLGVSDSGGPIRAANRGTKNYNWHIVRPRSQYLNTSEASAKEGDKRINSFGIGGSAEMRSGLLDQLVPMAGHQIHFGLGTYKNGDADRLYWPNGRMNGYFVLPANQTSRADQNLGGSCPWLFAWNGSKMDFVTDILWSSPLGLRINAQGTAPVGRTIDWVNLGADQLKPHDGYYDLRITAELWETHFFDMVKLMAVDHPEGTEVRVDERFSVPLKQPVLHVLTPPRPITRAVDDMGTDVTDLLRTKDNRYLDTFGRGEYQGITRDHFVEVDVAAAMRQAVSDLQPIGVRAGKLYPMLFDGHAKPPPVYLLAYGWTHPTDSSINVAISQGQHDPPRDISIEVPDGHGGWKVFSPHEGFPAGKNKTMLFDISQLRVQGVGKLRLRTNLEVYWDWMGVAAEAPGTLAKTETVEADTADLRYRGFSQKSDPHASTPEIPDYNKVVQTGPQWLDLVGYYTRFGDVRELLKQVDDRYVILNAGDEIALRFKGLPPPDKGMKRDFVFISDGWEKDGNFNTGFGQTVLPLPSHDNPNYTGKVGRLEDDPVYKRHKKDWETYQTRYVEPVIIRTGLRPSARKN